MQGIRRREGEGAERRTETGCRGVNIFVYELLIITNCFSWDYRFTEKGANFPGRGMGGFPGGVWWRGFKRREVDEKATD